MRYIVYGAGAIGGLVGARLAEQGAEVVLIARGDHAAAMEANHGIVVDAADGRRTVPVEVARTPAQAGLRPDDVVLLGMKGQDTGPALNELRRVDPALADRVTIACLQNGVDNERAALRLFPHVYAVCVMCPASHLEPGVVSQDSTPVPGMLDVGRYPRGTDGRSAQLREAFRGAGFESIERPEIVRWKYRKLLMNLGNAAQAVFPDTEKGEPDVVRRARAEAEACFRAAGIDVASQAEDLERRGDFLRLREDQGQARGGGSSWQSLQRGTGAIESDYLNGEVALLGRLHGVATPVNEVLQEMAWEAALRGDRPGGRTIEEFEARLARRADA